MVVEPIEIVKRIENKYGSRLSYLPDSTEIKACLPLFEDADTGILFVIFPKENIIWDFQKQNIRKYSVCQTVRIFLLRRCNLCGKVKIEPFLLSIIPILNVHILRYNKLFGKSVEKDGADYSPFFCEYEFG